MNIYEYYYYITFKISKYKSNKTYDVVGPQTESMLVCFIHSMVNSTHTSLKCTSCMPTSSIIAASSSMFGVTTRNAEHPCLNMPEHSTRQDNIY